MLDEIVDYVKFLRLQVKVILLLHYEISAYHFSTNPGFLDDVMLEAYVWNLFVLLAVWGWKFDKKLK